jgi:dTMP kinase
VTVAPGEAGGGLAGQGRGRFIAFEGGEGVGKSTQARLLGQAFAARGIPHTVTREPGGTPGAEAIRSLLLHGDLPPWPSAAEALLFAAARADHVERLIRPALAEGRWVLTDRFIDSSRAYQGRAGHLGDGAIMAMHRLGSGGLLPDAVVLLSLPPDIASERLTRRDGAASDHIGAREPAYHAEVAQAFAQMAAVEPRRFLRVDGADDPQLVHERVLAILASRFEELR